MKKRTQVILRPSLFWLWFLTAWAATTLAANENSALSKAAAAVPVGQWRVFPAPSLTAPYEGPYGKQYPTEDMLHHSCIDWANEGHYDPVTHRIHTFSTGAGMLSQPDYANVHLIYDEKNDKWSATRGSDGFVKQGIGHFYDNLFIHPTLRRLYKKTYQGDIIGWDLDAGRWVDRLPAIAVFKGGASVTAPHEIHPRLGAKGSIICFDRPWGRLGRYDLATGKQSLLPHEIGIKENAGSLMSYNGRADGGNGILAFGSGDKLFGLKADASLLTFADCPVPRLTLNGGNGFSKFTRDPLTSKWILFCDDGHLYEFDPESGEKGAWTNKMALPSEIIGKDTYRTQTGFEVPGRHLVNGFVVPLDSHGVILLVAGSGAGARCWLYRHSRK